MTLNYMMDLHGDRCACGDIATTDGMCGLCATERTASEIVDGQSFFYNGIEYRDVVVDHVTGRGQIVFYDDFDVRVQIEPLATVNLI